MQTYRTYHSIETEIRGQSAQHYIRRLHLLNKYDVPLWVGWSLLGKTWVQLRYITELSPIHYRVSNAPPSNFASTAIFSMLSAQMRYASVLQANLREVQAKATHPRRYPKPLESSL